MDTLQAAVLLVKLEVFADEVEARARIAARYGELLRDAVETPYIEPHNTSVYAQYTVQVDHREAIGKIYRKRGYLPPCITRCHCICSLFSPG